MQNIRDEQLSKTVTTAISISSNTDNLTEVDPLKLIVQATKIQLANNSFIYPLGITVSFGEQTPVPSFNGEDESKNILFFIWNKYKIRSQ